MYVNDGEKKLRRLMHWNYEKIVLAQKKAERLKIKIRKQRKQEWPRWHAYKESKKNEKSKENEKNLEKKISDLMGDPRYWGC